jgi:hypothetical protein
MEQEKRLTLNEHDDVDDDLLNQPNEHRQIHVNRTLHRHVSVNICHLTRVFFLPRLKPTTNGEIISTEFHNLLKGLQLV